MTTKGEFYVYRLFHQDMTLYIGKGCGGRLAKQKRHFMLDGEVVARFGDEDEAFAEEVRLIALHEPTLNKHPGGNGGRAGVCVPLPHGFTEEGLKHAAPYLAKLLVAWALDKSLVGILKIVGSYHEKHGFEALANAVVPHMRRLSVKQLPLQNNAI